MPENYMSSLFVSLPPSHFHTQSSHPLLPSIYPECLQEAGDHICTASHTCLITPGSALTHGKESFNSRGEVKRWKISGKVNGINISSTAYCGCLFPLTAAKSNKPKHKQDTSPSTSYIKVMQFPRQPQHQSVPVLMQSCKILLIHSRQVIF